MAPKDYRQIRQRLGGGLGHTSPVHVKSQVVDCPLFNAPITATTTPSDERIELEGANAVYLRLHIDDNDYSAADTITVTLYSLDAPSLSEFTGTGTYSVVDSQDVDLPNVTAGHAGIVSVPFNLNSIEQGTHVAVTSGDVTLTDQTANLYLVKSYPA